MTQHTFVYRGVTYTKAVPPVQSKAQASGRVYRGVGFEKSPKAPTRVVEHVYRGAHYAAAC